MLGSSKTQTPDYFTLKNFIEFLEKNKGEYQYDTTDTDCPIAQFMKEHGVKNPHVYFSLGGIEATPDGHGSHFVVPNVFGTVAETEPHTYEAALKRAQTTT